MSTQEPDTLESEATTPSEHITSHDENHSIPLSKWIVFGTLILFFVIITIALIIETIRTTTNPLLSILTTLIALPATIAGVLQFDYFRDILAHILQPPSPGQKSIPHNISTQAKNIVITSTPSSHTKTVEQLPSIADASTEKTGRVLQNIKLPYIMLPRIDWKTLWALFSSVAALSLFFNLLPTLSHFIRQPATISCAERLDIVQETATHEAIGISNGCFLFSSNQRTVLSKQETWSAQQQNADEFKQNNMKSLQNHWSRRIEEDSSDAESRIYQENARVQELSRPSIIAVVATMLTGDDASSIAMGKASLQGAYIQQKEYNSSYRVRSGDIPPLRLFIANIGSRARYSVTIAQQIVRLAENNPNMIGIMGWIFSARETQQAITILEKARIPSVSPTVSSDSFRGISPYFFRIAPTDSEQGKFSALYASEVLKARTAVVFVDYTNPYSSSLANGFSAAFKDTTHSIYEIPYIRGNLANNPGQAARLVDTAHKNAPNADLFFFAGYANDFDPVRGNLHLSGKAVIGGDALYELGGYQNTHTSNYRNITFTAFAHHDLWNTLDQEMPSFSKEYQTTFDPHNTRPPGAIDYNIPQGDAILSYDALGILLTAHKNASQRAIPPKSGGDAIRQALTRFTNEQPYFGLSGQIAFEANGGPANKPLLLLCTIDGQTTHIKGIYGRFHLDAHRYATLPLDTSPECRPNTHVQITPPA